MSSILKINEPLSKHTSLKVGGPAKKFVEATTEKELIKWYVNGHSMGDEVLILGGGTNVLVSDKGFKGLVLKNRVIYIDYLRQIKLRKKISKSSKKRKEENHWKAGFLNFRDIDYMQDYDKGRLIKVSAGTPLSLLIQDTLNHNVTGLEYFSGIPGTIGGAIWNNIHGADWLIGDFLYEVCVLYPNGTQKVFKKGEMSLGYNYSRFQNEKCLILWAKLILPLGDVERAKYVATEWKKRKAFQPRNSAGCTFSNLSPYQKSKANLENLSTAYLLDKVLNLKGKSIGGAQVSEAHANFITTQPGAKAKDIADLISLIENQVYEKFGIRLKEEIIRVG